MRRASSIELEIEEEHGELVTAETGDDVGVAQAEDESPRDRLEDVVAGLVAVRVVDALEVVDVDVQDRGAAVGPAGPLALPLELLLEPATVEQTGQRVVLGETGQLSLDALSLVDVLHLRDEVERLVVHAAHERDGEHHPDRFSVGTHVPFLHLIRAHLAGQQLPGVLDIDVDIVGMGDVLEGRGEQLCPGETGDLDQPLVDPEPAPVQRDEAHADRSVVEGATEALLRLAQGRLRVDTVVDVLDLGNGVERGPAASRTSVLVTATQTVVPSARRYRFSIRSSGVHRPGPAAACDPASPRGRPDG